MVQLRRGGSGKPECFIMQSGRERVFASGKSSYEGENLRGKSPAPSRNGSKFGNTNIKAEVIIKAGL